MIATLIIITQNQNAKHKAVKLSTIINSTLGIVTTHRIQKYYKFENSYKLEFTLNISSNDIKEVSFTLIELSDRICSPWTVYYDKKDELSELVFNKTENSIIRSNTFNVIYWANLFIDEE